MIFIFQIFCTELESYQQKGALLIDLRSYDEFLSHHIPSSIPLSSLKRFPKDKPIIFICNHGHFAKEYATYYRQYHYDCYYLEGGLTLYKTYLKEHPYY